MLKDIENSSYKILGDDNLQIDRVISKENNDLILQLRARNTTNKPVKIFSFIVAEFILPNKIEKILEHGWLQCSEVSWKNLDEPTKEAKLFLQRDQNHFSFQKEYGHIEGAIISEWFTLVKMYGEDLFIGAVTTADQFTQIFVKSEGGGTRIKVTCQYDGLILNPGQVVKSEKIFFAVGEESKIKKDFAESLAKHMNVKKLAPPIRAMCNSYYWNANKISDEIINNELDAIERMPEHLNLDYFELDAGYTRYFGDWLDYKDRFPMGFEPIIKRIKSLGYKPALWISPFAISPATKLHDHHASWLLKGDHKEHFEGRWTSPVDTLSNDIDLEVLDPTNDEVKKYLKGVLTHFMDLGFELFNTDFMYPVCLAEKYSKPVTRAQALREGVQFIRDTVGPLKLKSCITQLSPIIGLIDYVRTGIDTLNPFVCAIPGVNKMVNDFMLGKNIRESEERLFLNGIVWNADPDVLVFRDGTGIDEAVINQHKKMAKENNMSLWFGDSVANMDEVTKGKVLKFFNNV